MVGGTRGDVGGCSGSDASVDGGSLRDGVVKRRCGGVEVGEGASKSGGGTGGMCEECGVLGDLSEGGEKGSGAESAQSREVSC